MRDKNFIEPEKLTMKPLSGLKSRNTGSLKILGHLGALITMGAWGSSFVFTKVLMIDGGFTPVEMYTFRFIGAYILLLCMTFRKIFSNSWRDELAFLVCGICSGSLYFILENYALLRTTTGNVSLLASISPIFVTLLMALVYRQKIKGGVIFGSIVSFIGVGCVIFNQGLGFEIHPIGDLLALLAALSWAVYTVVVKRLIPVYNGFFITRKLFFYGVLSSLPLLLMQQEPYHVAELFDIQHPKYLLNYLFLVVFCSVLAYVIWNEVMKLLGQVMANNYLYLQPLVTLVVAYFVFDEKIFLLGAIGCVLIISGLVVSDKWDELREKRAEREIAAARDEHSDNWKRIYCKNNRKKL